MNVLHRELVRSLTIETRLPGRDHSHTTWNCWAVRMTPSQPLTSSSHRSPAMSSTPASRLSRRQVPVSSVYTRLKPTAHQHDFTTILWRYHRRRWIWMLSRIRCVIVFVWHSLFCPGWLTSIAIRFNKVIMIKVWKLWVSKVAAPANEKACEHKFMTKQVTPAHNAMHTVMHNTQHNINR